MRPITINNGVPMRGWYDIVGMDFRSRADMAGVQDSVLQLDALIAREIERGIAPEKIFLAGFSQGGAIILTAALSRTAPLAGLIALSTYLPEAESAKRADGAVQVPVFMAHGSSDPVIPQAVAVHSAQALQAMGLEVEWHSYPMAHQVCAEEIRRWVTGCGTPGRCLSHVTGQRPVDAGTVPPAAAAMLGLAELVVVVLALAPDGSRHWTFGELLSASGFALWLALAVTASLCLLRQALSSCRRCWGCGGHRTGDTDRGDLRRHRACAVRGAGRQLRPRHQLLARWAARPPPR